MDWREGSKRVNKRVTMGINGTSESFRKISRGSADNTSIWVTKFKVKKKKKKKIKIFFYGVDVDVHRWGL
jgi:hypothetical protein